MCSRLSQITILIAFVFGGAGCGFWQHSSPEQKARECMAAFQDALAKPDDEILQLFETDQSAESLLAAVNLLRHEDNELVDCEAYFSKMQIEVEHVKESTASMLPQTYDVVTVTVPVTVRVREGDTSASVDLVFRLKEKNNQLIIYQLEGDAFYNAFTAMKHDIQYARHQDEEIKNREAIYATADSLAQKFEHVVWYAQYKGEVYFYVVSGEWNEASLRSDQMRPSFRMGLVNSQGREIIPLEYEMIGTIGAEVENAVEVNGPDGYGYFSLEGDTLVPPVYKQIIPLDDSDLWMVESDNGLGWLDKNKNFREGFPNKEVADNFQRFSYLPSSLTISESQYTLCESLDRESAGSGVFISPSYWVMADLIEPLRFGISTTVTDAPIGGWTEYIEMGETLFESITDNIGVVVASFKERYLEGREEFYEHKKLLFKDSLHNTVLAQDYSRGALTIRKISEGVVEVTTAGAFEDMYYEGMPMEGELVGGNTYRYYQFDNYSVTELSSNRSHPETEFAKLDDSYMAGDFKMYNDSLGNWESFNTIPLSVLKLMRNEILADYGVTFEDEALQQHFKTYSWYSPRFNSEAEIEESLTEIDRHNLKFLANAVIQAESI